MAKRDIYVDIVYKVNKVNTGKIKYDTFDQIPWNWYYIKNVGMTGGGFTEY